MAGSALSTSAPRDSVIRRVCCIALTLAIVACADGRPADQLRTETTRAGDTTIVTTRGRVTPVRIDSVDVLWQSDELENPRALIAVSGRLFVADRARLHILSDDGEHIRTVGRAGEGPGEFRSISAMAVAGRDTIAVHDVSLQRISFVTLEGDHVRAARAAPRVPFVNPVDGSALLVSGGEAFSFWQENVQLGRPTRTALVWRDLEVDTIAVLDVLDGASWAMHGEFVVTVPLFGPQALVALAPDGTTAAGDGLDYCITIRALGSEGVRRICREWERPSPGPAVRSPDLGPVDSDDRRAVLARLIREQPIADHLPSYDRLLFDDPGRLWVRTVAPEQAEVHPYLLRYQPEARPAYRAWDVFETSGSIVGTFELPSTFDPKAITENRVLGFAELESGEIVVAEVSLPSGIANSSRFR